MKPAVCLLISMLLLGASTAGETPADGSVPPPPASAAVAPESPPAASVAAAPESPPPASRAATPESGVVTASGGATLDPEKLLSELDAVLDELLLAQPYHYRSGGRRDPFVALVTADGEIARHDLPSVDEITVVGVLWSEEGYLALIETLDGRSLILRAGDPIRHGKVRAVDENGMTVRHTRFGITRTVILPIVSAEEENDER